MGVEGGAEHHPAAGRRSIRDRLRSTNWQAVAYRGSQAVGVASLALALVLAYRFRTTHGWADPTTEGDDLVPILLALLLFALSASVLVFRPDRGALRRLAWTAAAWSVALLVTLGCVWYLVDSTERERLGVGTPLLSQADVDAYLAEHRGTATGEGGEQPLLIPTGVLVQSIEFLNANNVEVAGYVWQKYGPSVPSGITRGFVLPEAVAEAYEADEAYRFEEADGTQLIGWHFDATLRLAFDYRGYPFDRQDVRLRLWHRDFERGVVLVPDLASYRSLEPAALPGIEEQFVYEGWDPEFATFSYAVYESGTTFGYGTSFARAGFPELYFNVGLKRDFLNPFFGHIVFTIVAALLLFAILGLTTEDKERKPRIGVSPFGIVGSCAGVLFAVVLQHAQIRSEVSPRQVAYLETLPFLLYLTVLLVALNAILLASPLDIKLIRYRDNILPVLIYWPLLLGLLLIVTVVTFFS